VIHSAKLCAGDLVQLAGPSELGLYLGQAPGGRHLFLCSRTGLQGFGMRWFDDVLRAAAPEQLNGSEVPSTGEVPPEAR